jgi:hypothetical protein
MMSIARPSREWRHWLVPVCVIFLALFIGLQAVHVHLLHPHDDLAGGPCLVCVSAHSSAPVAIPLAQILLIAVASVSILREWKAPTCDAVLPLFIRPPPAR